MNDTSDVTCKLGQHMAQKMLVSGDIINMNFDSAVFSTVLLEFLNMSGFALTVTPSSVMMKTKEGCS